MSKIIAFLLLCLKHFWTIIAIGFSFFLELFTAFFLFRAQLKISKVVVKNSVESLRTHV